MRTMIDNAILICFCVLSLLETIPIELQLLLLTGTVAYAAFSYYTEQKKLQLWLSALWLCVLCMVDGGVIYLPVIWYHLLMQRRKWALAVVAFCGTVLCTQCVQYGLAYGMVVLVFITATWLCLQTVSNEKTEQKLISLRDSDVELSMNLKQQNKELAQMKEQEIHMATLSERNRIAREIHDNVGHMLSRAILQVGALQAICRQENLVQPMEDLQDSLNQAMNSIRSSVHDLKDESIDVCTGIRQALDGMSGYEVQFEYDANDDMPGEYKYCFIAIVKEALSNIAKHSDGKRIFVQLLEHPAFYQLVIEDNGSVSKNDDRNGMGILNMEERVSALGGTFLIQRERGYRIFVSVPKK